jgi:Fe-S-cluster containining protein
MVPISEAEVSAMARHLEMSEWDFVQQFTELRPHRDGLALLNRANGECIFLEGRDCRVQEAKPIQCREFPNGWNFPGWREVCEAVPELRFSGKPSQVGTTISEEGAG